MIVFLLYFLFVFFSCCISVIMVHTRSLSGKQPLSCGLLHF
uniref:Uncharacterized protein n=1 Tax=Anguilla anguilla TaxID=7936 RepID=A0A0E9S789_ANGAN